MDNNIRCRCGHLGVIGDNFKKDFKIALEKDEKNGDIILCPKCSKRFEYKEEDIHNKPLKCFQCKHWQSVVQECDTPEETYDSIIRDKNFWGKILGACTANKKGFPMFDIDDCGLKDEYKHLAERIKR